MAATVVGQHRYSDELLTDLSLVAGELTGAFTGLPERERRPILHTPSGPGKLLRPVVVLAASRYSAAPAPERIEVAAAAEMIHLASLIHDDVIDCALMRRGRPSLNASWGEGVAILTGDVYFAGALDKLTRLCNGSFVPMFLECVAAMCQSELRQTLARFDPGQSEESYLSAISGKTASLFATCSRAGALLSGLRDGEQAALAKYGWSLGMAFQLADDVADLTAGRDHEPAGQDLKAGIWTLPLLHGLRSKTGEAIYRLIASEHAGDELPEIRAALGKSGSFAYATARARVFCCQARAALAMLPGAEATATLHSVIDRVEADLVESEAACD